MLSKSSPPQGYAVYELPAGAPGPGYEPHGAIINVWNIRVPEWVVSGPAETGKTLGCLQKLHALMNKYHNSQALMVRKTRNAMTASVLQTFERKVLGHGNPVKPLGGRHVERYEYPNGSQIFIAGMDDPGKALSSEWDFIYVNQAEELNLDDWETLSTRCTGRAGNTPYSMIFGDCNPGGPSHWIKKRAADNKLKIIESRHEDNPTLFDPVTGTITDQGIKSMSVLDNLTGVRYLRLRKGLWAAAEGAVYEEWDTSVHLIDRFPIPQSWTRVIVIDFGYTNPFVAQWWALDEDGRMYKYREIYMSHRIVADHARDIHRYSEGETIYAVVADHDAEDRATLEAAGINTLPAMKRISLGIQAVQVRLRKAGDGRPRIFIMRDSLVEEDPDLKSNRLPLKTEEEIEGYVWKPDKEEPVKKNDHGCDCLRYVTAFVDDVQPADVKRQETIVYDDDDYQISPI